MKRLLALSVYLLACLMVSAQKKSKAKGWIQLFNGKNLDGWTVKIKDHPVNDNFGNTFRVSIFGESHGNGVGVVLDGIPAGLPIKLEDFKTDLGRRRSGAKGTTPRKEADLPKLVSGVFNS